MHDKLKLLLDKIDIGEEFYSHFNNGKVEKVILNKEAKKSCFVLSLDNTLPLDIYISLKDKITSTFHTINIFDSIQVESEKFLFFVIIWFICFFVDIERFTCLNFLHDFW